jgi:hypothetical protein
MKPEITGLQEAGAAVAQRSTKAQLLSPTSTNDEFF